MDNRPVFQWTTDTLFSRERFEAWLAEQPGERGFEYCHTKKCVLCGFIRETTSAPLFQVGPDVFNLEPDYWKNIPLAQWAIDLLNVARSLRDVGKPITIIHLRTAYHKLFNIDVMEIHAPVTLTPQPERV